MFTDLTQWNVRKCVDHINNAPRKKLEGRTPYGLACRIYDPETLMLDGSEYLCEGHISEAARNLSQFGFFQIQRSYIVNLKYIEKADSRKITLCNGLEIGIGRTHSNEFKKAFFQWRMLFDD